MHWGDSTVLGAYELPHGVLCVSAGSVETFPGDAIVNAANTGCQGGGGVDGAITAAGGQGLADARRKLPALDGEDRWERCRVGDAVVTAGGDLAAKWCVHAVGPDYNSESAGGDVRERRLAKFRQNVARFRLYRLRFLQENMRFAAFFKIYQIFKLTFLKFGNILQI